MFIVIKERIVVVAICRSNNRSRLKECVRRSMRRRRIEGVSKTITSDDTIRNN